MERKNFLIDTNIAIYYFGLLLSESSESFLDLLIRKSYCISVINRIELLGFSELDRNQYSVLETFVANATILELDEPVVVETIKIRRYNNIKLPDAIIAATCIVNNCCLVTNNRRDFEKIEGLMIETMKLA